MSDVSHSILHYGLYHYRTASNQWNFREYFLSKKKKKKEQKLGIIETWIWVIFTLLYWKISPDDYMQPILLSAISIQSLLFNM